MVATLVSLLSGSEVKPENIYSCILKVIAQVWESQKGIINTNHSYCIAFIFLSQSQLILQ